MANPLTGLAKSTAFSTGVGASASAAGATIGFIAAGTGMTNSLKEVNYLGNGKLPNNFPDPSYIIASYLRGYLGYQTAHDSLLVHGINMLGKPNTPTVTVATAAWRAVEQLMLPRPSLDFAYWARARKIISQDEYLDLRKHHADRYGTMVGAAAAAMDPVGISRATALLHTGVYSEQQWKNAVLRETGWNDERLGQVYKLTYVIPPITDQIRFVVREAYNEEQVEKLGLDKEYGDNKLFSYWISKAGLREIPANTFTGQKEAMDWGKMYWRAHWALPSPTQVFVMLHRLRPGAEDRFQHGDFKPEPVNEDDVKSLLKANDYAPGWRDRLAAISYSPLTRVDIRRIFFADGIDEREVYECYRDLGYDDRNANIITGWLIDEKKKKKDKDKDKKTEALRKKLADKIVASYRIGALKRDAAYAAIVALKIDKDAASYMLDIADLEAMTQTVVVYAESIRKEYFLGLYTADEAYGELVSAGISHEAAERMMGRWNRQLRVPRRVASANTILAWFREGLIQEDEVLLRLHNLGYSNMDQLLYLQSARLDIEKQKLRQQAAMARNEKSKSIASRRAVDQFKRERKEARAELQRLFGEDDAKRWYIAGLWGEENVTKALSAIDFTKEAIDLRLAEWRPVRENRQ